MNAGATTLFSDIQRLFERTYAGVGINLEDCLIDQRRCKQLTQLAGASARELSSLARTFLRRVDDQLYVGIYYSSWLIEQLEKHDPRGELGDHNIHSLIAFVEEINHALHACLQFQRGERAVESEDFIRNLELQAQVDSYLVLMLFIAFFRKTQKLSKMDRRWLRYHLFQSQDVTSYEDQLLVERYRETTELAEHYTYYLDTLNGARRLAELQRFHALDYPEKKAHVLALPAPGESQLPADPKEASEGSADSATKTCHSTGTS